MDGDGNAFARAEARLLGWRQPRDLDFDDLVRRIGSDLRGQDLAKSAQKVRGSVFATLTR
jgi:hypothetical protein